MKRVVLSLLALGLCVSTAGCYATNFVYRNKSGGRVVVKTQPFYIFGLVRGGNAKSIKAYQLCPEGVANVETIHTFGNLCLSCITAQIYTPDTVRITCAAGTAYNFYLDQNHKVVARVRIDGKTGKVTRTVVASDAL